MEVLTAYVRNKSPLPKGWLETPVEKRKSLPAVTTDVQSALTVIGRREAKNDLMFKRLVLGQSNLSSAQLGNADLDGADLTDANLTGADLSETIALAVDFQQAKALTQQQLEGEKPPLLCNVVLPKGMQVNPNRDCDRLPQKLVERHDFKSLDEAKKYVDEQR